MSSALNRCLIRAVPFALLAVCASSLQASYVQGYTECFSGAQPTLSDITGVPGATASVSVTGCSASASATYGSLKLGGSATVPQPGYFVANATAQMYIDFYLQDLSAAPGASINVTVPIHYSFTIVAAGGSLFTGASFGLTYDSGTTLLRYSTANDAYANNNCPAPQAALVCNGTYSGTYGLGLTIPLNGWNRFWLTANSQDVTNGSTDATHTITLGNIIIPSTVTPVYSDLTGNPMNFTDASAVPEPSGMWLCGAAGVLLGIRRTFRRCR